MANILGIGTATVDIINTVASYPLEDSEIRATKQRIARGGNVTNTLVILSQLGHHCTWGGVGVNDPDGQFILAQLADYAIDTSPCRLYSQGKVPTSYILLNQQNGSRTIVHYRDLPEFSGNDFQQIDLAIFNWLHFEARQITETTQMIRQAKQQYPNLPISLEVEKPRPQVELLFTQVDILLFSQTFAQYYSHVNHAELFLHSIHSQAPQAYLICAWGTDGAYALTPTGDLLHSPAFLPAQVVDTLGAGDVFNAGIIDSLCRQQELATALTQACQLAGQKCGQEGLQLIVKPAGTSISTNV